MRRYRCVIIFLASTVTLSLVGLLAVLGTSSPQNVLTPRGDGQFFRLTSTLLPQGWGFFTRNPEEARLTVYLPREESGSSDQWAPDKYDAPNPMDVGFGFSRARRNYQSDAVFLRTRVTQTHPEAWERCVVNDDSDISGCVENMRIVDIESTDLDPINSHWCNADSLVLAALEPVPFAYRDLTDARVGTVIKVGITC